MRNALIAEFVGTFFLYLIIAACITPPGAAALTPIAVAIGLAALIYSCGHHSKAHFNPATTVTYFCAGTHNAKTFLPFIAVIIIGAAVAAFTLPFLYPERLANIRPLQIELPQAVLAEFLFTFALMWVILNVAIAKGTKGNGFYGIAIGGIVGAGAYAVGPISFAAFNPAVTLAMCINGFLPWFALIPYSIAQITAAALAGLLFRNLKVTDTDELNGKPWN